MASRSDALTRYARALRQHRAVLDRILDRRSALQLKRYYDKTQDDLERAMARMAKDTRNDPLTPLQAQQLLAVVYKAQADLARKLHSQFIPISEEAQEEGVRETDRTITSLEAELGEGDLSLPLLEPTIMAGLVERRRAYLDRANAASFRQYGIRLNQAAQQRMAVSLAVGESSTEAIDSLRQTLDSEWWQGERIIVTEMAKAYNLAHADSIVLVGQELRDLKKRWTELVDDVTGMPMDSRVGNDSLVLHGQITSMDGIFVMPPDPSVHRSFWNQTYDCSPNRPNDRSVTMPWRPGWKVPGWIWQDGQRVDLPNE
jgi:hypothetical protein